MPRATTKRISITREAAGRFDIEGRLIGGQMLQSMEYATMIQRPDVSPITTAVAEMQQAMASQAGLEGCAKRLQAVLNIFDQHHRSCQKIRYAAGKNYNKLRAITKQTTRLYDKAVEWLPDYAEYVAAVQELGTKYAEQDKDGRIVYEKDKDTGEQLHIFSKEAEIQVQKEQKALDKQYAKVIKAQQDKVANAEKRIMSATVKVDLYTCDPDPWALNHLAGGHLEYIEDVYRTC